ncbi:MAG: DUF3857 domain-containing protein [Salinivirgaceae bacterium]|nr:DUF3857 domain-containing protein [Salinivirgaceae bacterium]
MKIIYLMILGLFLFGCSENVENNDGEYLKIKKEYTFNEDGSYTLTHTHKLLYGSYFAFHRLFGETFIAYDPNYQTLTFEKSETTMADGKRIIVPENAFNVVLPRWASRSGAYNHMHEMVVTHTGLEIGAIVDLSYTIESKNSPLDYTQIYEPLQYSIPVDELEIIFNVPTSIAFTTMETDVKPLIEEKRAAKRYKYTFKNINSTEKNNPSTDSFIPHLVAQAKEKSMLQLLNEIDPGNTPIKSIKGKQLDIALDVQSEMIKIKTISVPSEHQIFPLQSVELTKERNSGSPLEKTVLFQSLLLEKGIESNILLKIPEVNFDENMATLNAVTDYFLVVNVANKPMALSATYTHKNNPLEEQGYVYVSKKGVEKPSSANENFLKSNTTITLAKNKNNISITSTEEIEASISLFGEIQKSGTQPNPKDITSTVGSKLESYTLNDFGTATLKLKGFSNVESDENILKLNLPPIKIGIDHWNISSFSDSSRTSIQLPTCITEESTFQITLPEGAKPILKSSLVTQTASFGEIEISFEIKEGAITAKRRISLKTSVIEPNDFPAFAKMMRLWNDPAYRSLYVDL